MRVPIPAPIPEKETIMEANNTVSPREPWNKGKLVGRKVPFKLKEIWAIRVRLQLRARERELALFNPGIDSKLRACDLVKLRVREVCHGERVASRATVLQQKTRRPVPFEITPATQEAIAKWIQSAHFKSEDFLFPGESRRGVSPPRARRTVREPLDSHRSRYPAIGRSSFQ
jgi:hypothetical protein